MTKLPTFKHGRTIWVAGELCRRLSPDSDAVATENPKYSHVCDGVVNHRCCRSLFNKQCCSILWKCRRAVDGCSSYQKLWILLEQPVVLEWHLWKVERCSRMFVRFTGSWKKKHVWYDTQSLIENTRCKWLKVIKAIITLMILYEMILTIFTRCWFVFQGFQHPVQLFFFLVEGSGPWCEPFQPLGPRLKMSDPKIETMNKPIDMIGLVVPKLQFQFETWPYEWFLFEHCLMNPLWEMGVWEHAFLNKSCFFCW